MNPEITLFTQVRSYYRDLVDQLETARDTISMTYLAFDTGEWAERIAQVLQEKVAFWAMAIVAMAAFYVAWVLYSHRTKILIRPYVFSRGG